MKFLMNYQDQTTAATDHRFINKVQQAALEVAVAILSEASSGNPDLDTARATLARQWMNAPQEMAKIFSYSIATDDRLDSSYTDATVKTIVTDLWNEMAGFNPNQ